MTAPADSSALSYLARRGVAAQWRGFLRALVETLDANLDPGSRDSLMRAVGGRFAALMPLPPCSSMQELESRMNDALAAVEWGWAELSLNEQAAALEVTHSAAPIVATAEDGQAAWIAAVLEGLYAAWFAGQPGADQSLGVRLMETCPARTTLRYGRG